MDSALAYEVHARDFLLNRNQSEIGKLVVERWSRTLSPGAAVIELVCGGGYPISTTLSAADLKLWAVDSSPSLLAAFQARLPDVPVQCAKVQETDFFNREFDAVIAVGLIFLLPESDQLKLIASVSKSLRPEGRFLFTAPIELGEWLDMNTGLECRSLGRDIYEKHLCGAGFRVLATFADKGANNYYDVELVASGPDALNAQ